MSRILVTGATGFLGRHVIDALLANDASPAPAGRIRIFCRTANPWPDRTRIEYVQGDITDRDAVSRAVSGVEVVLHLAGAVRRDKGSGKALFDVHVGGTRNVCEAALARGRPRLILASSSGTIAVSRRPVIHTESTPYAARAAAHWPYYLSKIEQEKLAFAYHETGQLEVVVLNPSMLLGPGDLYRSSTNDVRAFLDHKVPNIPSGGLNFVDARDAARAFLAAIGSGRPGQRYLIGGHNMTVREFLLLLERVSGVRGPRLALPEWLARGTAGLARAAASLAGRRFPIDDATIEMAYRFWYCDSGRAAKELNFRARPADDTIRDMVRFIRDRSHMVV